MRSGRRVWAGEHPQNRAKQVTTDSALAKVAKDYRLGAIDSVEPVRDAGHVPIDAPVRNVCEPYQKAVELGLRRGRNTRGIWQDLVSDCSFSSSYVQRFVRQVGEHQQPHPRQNRGLYRIREEDHTKRTPLRTSQLL